MLLTLQLYFEPLTCVQLFIRGSIEQRYSPSEKLSIMEQFLYILIIIFGVFGLSFILINIRHIFTGNEFRGTCATNNPMLKKDIGECSVCGKGPDEQCKLPEPGNTTAK